MQTLTREARLALVSLALPLLVVTCSKSTEPNVATTIVITPGADTLHAIGRTQRFTAAVKDQHGNPLTSAKVTWGTTNAAVVTVDTSGLATAVAPGSGAVTATSGSAGQQATVLVAQVAAQLTKTAGDGQTGPVGTALGQALVVNVTDSTGHPIVGDTVSFSAAAGNGSVGAAKVASDASGNAQTSWVLGTALGSEAVSASAPGAAVVAFIATATVGTATRVAKQAGDVQTSTSGANVAVAPAVMVTDTFNHPKPGVTVTFSVPNAASGSVTRGTPVSDVNGIATVGAWTLGSVGKDTLTATVSGAQGSPLVFTATAVAAGTPASVAVVAGNNLPGLVGFGVNVRPAVKVTDAANNPVPNAAVTFAVASGGGSVTGGSATTNANGIAQVTKWTLGGSAGVNTLTATVTGSGITGNPVTFADTGLTASYPITVQFYGPTPSAAATAAVDSAAARWQRIIYRGLSSVNLTIPADSSCGAGEPALN